MTQENKTVEQVATEITAIVSILTENFIDPDADFDKEEIIYSIHLTLVGATILPPFLPCIKAITTRRDRNRIIKELDELRVLYNSFYDDWILSEEEGIKIMSAIEALGKEIAHYLKDFVSVLENIANMNVYNIIIHTDDFAIPWTWAYYHLSANQLRYLPQPADKQHDFLCNRYPCGTLVVDNHRDALQRMQVFRQGFISSQTDETFLKHLKVCLFQGVLGVEQSREKEKGKYLKNLKQILGRKFNEGNIDIFGYEDWKADSGDSENFVDCFLSGKVKNAKIVHFSGHVSDGVLKFDDKTNVHPQHLGESLYRFRQHPLIVLHGCSTGKVVNIKRMETQLPTVLLERGASGCIVALLPVDLPIYLDSASENMMTIFYKKVVEEMKPYGQALFEARRQFQNQEKTKYNPQWLFYHLYGDPRAMMITTSKSSYLRFFEEVDDIINEEERERKFQFGICIAKDLIEPKLLISELESEGYTNIEKDPAAFTLGVNEVFQALTSPEAIEIYKFIGTTTGACLIKESVKHLFDKIFKKNGKKLVEIDPQKLSKNQKNSDNVLVLKDLTVSAGVINVYTIENLNVNINK